jgi:hypothetical protein
MAFFNFAAQLGQSISAISQLRDNEALFGVAGETTKGSDSPGSLPQHESASVDLSTLLQQSATALSAFIAVIFGAAQHELDGLCL